MKLKKPMKVKVPSAAAPAAGAAEAAPASGGGATIADRFKLEPVAPAKAKGGAGVSKAAAAVALVAAVVALVVSGALTFIIYNHWEFLKSA